MYSRLSYSVYNDYTIQYTVLNTRHSIITFVLGLDPPTLSFSMNE